MKKLAPILLLLLLLATPLVLGEIDFDEDISRADERAFDEILSPVMKIYNFIKYAATVAGVLMLVFAGVSFVMSGGDQAKKEKAKHMAIGVVIGLIVIWVAPLVVEFIF